MGASPPAASSRGGGLAGLYSPTSAGLPRAGVGPATLAGAIGARGPVIVGGLRPARRPSTIVGTTLDVYSQNSRNYAFFTHNIFHITDQLDLTLGLRYTNERKRLRRDLQQRQHGLPGAAGVAARRSCRSANAGRSRRWRGGLIGLTCQGNSTRRAERRLDQRPPQRGRVDRHRRALVPADQRPAALRQLFARLQSGRLQPRPLGAQVADLRRSPIHAGRRPGAGRQPPVRSRDHQRLRGRREIFARRRSPSTSPPSARISELPAEHVQRHGLPGPDDQRLRRPIVGAATDQADRRISAGAPAPARPDDVSYGVRSQGVEVEAAIRPRRDMPLNARPHLCRHQYRNNLVGNEHRRAARSGALRCCRATICRTRPNWWRPASFTWTPQIGNSRPDRPVLCRCARDRRLQYRLGPVPAEGAGQLSPSSTPASACAGRTSAGRSSCGRRTCSTPIMRRSRSTRRSRRARPPRRSSIRNSRADGRSSRAFLAEPRTYGITGRFRF